MKINRRFNISLLLLAVFFAFALASCNNDDDDDDNENPEGYMLVTAMEAAELIDENQDLVIIDVSPYFDDGHIPGAVNYPIGDGTFDETLPTLDENLPYLVYCHGDSPAIAAAEKLVDAGFEMVYRLEGNYQAWVDAGYDIEY